jgi:nucleotide-binding universal stress UspA family protein
MRRILAATDGSEGANRAVAAGASIAASLNSELWIVYVVDGIPNDVLEQFAREEGTNVGDALHGVSRRVLLDAQRQSQKLGAKTIHLEERSGDSAEEILKLAHEIGADAIFAGRRGLGRLEGLLLGSVSQKLVCLAPCMVVIVP